MPHESISQYWHIKNGLCSVRYHHHFCVISAYQHANFFSRYANIIFTRGYVSNTCTDNLQCLILSLSEVLYATVLHKFRYLLANNSAVLLDSRHSINCCRGSSRFASHLTNFCPQILTFVAKHCSCKPTFHNIFLFLLIRLIA